MCESAGGNPRPVGAGASALSKDPIVFIISAPSGSGKSTLVHRLLAEVPGLTFSVSYTTRAPRGNEQDGASYHYISRQDFETRVANDEFLEHAEVFGNYYGTPQKKVVESLNSGRDVLFDIDWQGTMQLAKNAREDLVSIFILPPSRSSLEQRLRARSTDSEAVIERRLRDAAEDLGHWNEFDYVVINDRFEQALEDLRAIVEDRGSDLIAQRPEVAHFAAGLLQPP